jgi:hypothetical protein
VFHMEQNRGLIVPGSHAFHAILVVGSDVSIIVWLEVGLVT